jgi:hypothetical protein
MKTSRVLRSLCVIGLLFGIGVAAAIPAGAEPGRHGDEGSWPGDRSSHFPIDRDRPTTTCSGTLTSPGLLSGTYASNVVVSGLCVVNGGPTTILGNLTLSPGSGLNATFALNDVSGSGTTSLSVHGSVVVQSGAVLAMGCELNHSPCSDDPAAATGGTLTGSNTIYGNLIEFGALGSIVHASTISGNVFQLGGGGGLSCVPPTTGIFSLLQSPVFSDYEDNTIGGTLGIASLQTCYLGALRNNVSGNVLDWNNTFGDPDANEVNSNTVQGNMACFHNSPAVQYGDSTGGVPNQVGGWAIGECGFGVQLHNPVPSGPLTPISVRSPDQD